MIITLEDHMPIRITLFKDGKMKVAVEGVKGESCTDVDAFLRKLGTVVKDEKTDEFYQEEVEVEEQIRRL